VNRTFNNGLYLHESARLRSNSLPKLLIFLQLVALRRVSALLTAALLLMLPGLARAQGSSALSRITAPINESNLTTLQGNTHPLARAEFDRGAAPTSLAMNHMLLVLKRSPGQEAALEALLAQQQDKTSPKYHNWLTPGQFGLQFGPSDQDIQTITSWLQSYGFQNVNVSNGRTTIDFSGTAGQVQAALHTTIHKYVLADGEEHWANATDPQIPSALNTVVAGVHSLNNFPKKSFRHARGVVRRSTTTGKFTSVSPEFTFGPLPNGCSGVNPNCYGVGPGDFSTIYNVPATINGVAGGTGQTIAIVSDSDIYASDVTEFRSLFSLPAINFNQIETGTDPGVVFDNGNGDELEAVLDVEWSGAVAQGATIDLVVSPSTNNTFGGDSSAVYVVDGHITPQPYILSYSYGDCELQLGTTGNQFYNTLWQQAAAEGITVLVAAGDNGSAGCDIDQLNGPPSQPAEFGLEVNGIASTPYNVAVGGTDFNDFNNPTTYFTNTPGLLSSAIGYIPETAYNDTCTNSIIYSDFFELGSAELACNNATVQSDGFVVTAGGGGGASNCTTPNGPGPSNCSGGYAKPSWQVGTGVPADGLRDLPDVSLFAGDGTIQNFYVVCESDYAGFLSTVPPAPCSLASPYQDFVGEGGTSVSTQAFAGIVALMNQKQGGPQGNINPLLYTLAGESSASSVFHDVTVGTNAMPCLIETGVTGCTITGTGLTVGLLNGYSTGPGYDQATGLGSVNVANLVNNAGPNFYVSSTNPAVTVSSPGKSGNAILMTVTSVNGFSGSVTFACLPTSLPAGATCTFTPPSVPLAAGTLATPGTASTTLTVQTVAAGSVSPSARPWVNITWETNVELTMGLFSLTVVLICGLRKDQRKWSMVPGSIAFGFLLIAAACGGSSSGTSSPTPTPVVSLSPSSLTFTSQNINTTSTAQNVTLSNTGTAGLSVSSITASTQFGASNNCGATVASGANCTIQVTFDPTTPGAQTGTLTISDNAAGSSQTVALGGTGTTTGGSGGGGTPMGMSTITVTATSGSISFPMSVTLNVQ